MEVKKTPSPELQEWLNFREYAFGVKASFREAGGHMLLKDSVVDPSYLDEPLRAEAMEYLNARKNTNNQTNTPDAEETRVWDIP